MNQASQVKQGTAGKVLFGISMGVRHCPQKERGRCSSRAGGVGSDEGIPQRNQPGGQPWALSAMS
jgi:hypothetical protein